MRTVLFLWLLASTAQCQDTVREFEQRQAQEKDQDAIKLWLHLDQWVRSAYGCPLEGEFTVKDCRKERVMPNVKEFEAAKRFAKRLFDLKDKKPITKN